MLNTDEHCFFKTLSVRLAVCDFSSPQEEVLAANKSKLNPARSFQVTLALEDATVDTAIDVFQDISNTLLSRYDSCALQLIPDNYLQQICAMKTWAIFPFLQPQHTEQ